MKEHVLTTTLKHLHEDYSFKAYYMAKLGYYNFLHGLNSKTREKVIVYQMGKVGSSTVVSSLQTLTNFDVYHVHALTKAGIKSVENSYKENFHRLGKIHEHLLESQYLRKQLDKGLEGQKKWKIVTLVRDPIAKNVSSFFFHLEDRLNYQLENKVKYMNKEDIIEELREIFIEKFKTHDKPLTWLDFELKPVFSIDIYSREFPKSKGYEIYESDSADVLLIRLENLDECAGEAFKNFLGINEFTLVDANMGSNKSYSDIYRRFLRFIDLPEFYIDKMYTSKYARHFYSEEEIEAFKAKWRRQNHT